MGLWINRKLRSCCVNAAASFINCGFRSKAAIEAIEKAREERVKSLVLYNYPSFSGAFSALFSHLFHSRLRLPSLILPFSSVEPFRVEDLHVEGLERCYLLDFVGPKGFAEALSLQSMCEVICFDHQKPVLSRLPHRDDCLEKVKFLVDLEKSSSITVYDYFSNKLMDLQSMDESVVRLLDPDDQPRVELTLKYIQDIDLRRWSLPDIRAFNIGLSEWRAKINCITNPYMYEELLEICSDDLIAKGNSYISSRQSAVSKLTNKVFKLRLGGGLYGECLGVRADGNSDMTDEIGKYLSTRSAAAGLRPIGAVVSLQRKSLKICLRSTDDTTDTSEVAKAYGGGGSPRSSSFMIRMNDYNQWLSGDAS